MRAKDLLVEFYEPEDDLLIKAQINDTRRAKLTLKHLNKLRKIRDMEREDNARHLADIKVIYAAQPTE